MLYAICEGQCMPKKTIFAPLFCIPNAKLTMNNSELNTLVTQMKAGDRESFNQIFRRSYKPLMRFCFRFIADEDVAAEIVQDLFVKLWTNREKLNISSSFDSYMMTSVRNAAYTYINKERAHNEAHQMMVVQETDETDPSEQLQSNNLEASYRKILAEMPEKRREVFVASRFEGLKYAEIAEKLNISQ